MLDSPNPAAVHVFLGTPVGGGVVAHEYVQGLLGLQAGFARRGWGLTVETRPDALVTRSRNHFASRVVARAEFTHLLMIDADVVADCAAVERLVDSGHAVTGAVVALRQVAWDRVRATLDLLPDATAAELAAQSHRHAVEFLGQQGWQEPVDGFLPVRSLGGAVLLIRREALVALAESGTLSSYDAQSSGSATHPTGWTFFDPLVDERGVYLSEDYALCHRWRTLGGQVWADIRSQTHHIGPVAVTGDIAATLAVASRIAEQQCR